MSLIQATDEHEQLIILTGCIGSVIGLVVCTILLVISLCDYRVVFYEESSPQTNNNVSKTPFKLKITYIMCCILQCISQAFVKTNAIVPYASVTVYHCAVGLFVGSFMPVIGTSLIYIIFLHRIQNVFTGSTYEYKPYIFKLLYSFIILVPLLWLGFRAASVFYYSTSYTYYSDKNIIYCHWSNPPKNVLYILLGAVFTYHISISVVLLSMFISRLVALQKALINSFLREVNIDNNINIDNNVQIHTRRRSGSVDL
eukprot:479358_1